MRARSLLLPVSVVLAWSASFGCSADATNAAGAARSAASPGCPGDDAGDPGQPGSPGSPGNPGGGTGTDGGAGPPPACAPSWDVTPACGGLNPAAAPPDFGPNVLVFDPGAPSVQSKLDDIYGQQDAAQFGDGRYAFFFKPGKYDLDVKLGFYTQAIGLGQSPDDVAITGAVRAKADWLGNNNATCNFWRGADNLSVTPTQAIDNGVDRWAVSQGTHLRRLHVKGNLTLDDGGWSSGGFIADSVVDGTTNSGTQQQFLTRNVDLNWQGQNWNMVFVGDGNAPQASWPHPPYTVVDKTPRIREKPFLYLDRQGRYAVMVPALETDRQGHTWTTNAPPGLPVSIDHFHVAKPGDTAATLNAALAAGKDLMFTPGTFHLDAALHVTRPGTVVMGLGLATLVPDTGAAILAIDDVDGVTVAGLLLEAGPTSSPSLLEVGPSGSSAAHAAHPTALFDVHCRVGGTHAGAAKVCITVNSHDVLIDNAWLWRADHGASGEAGFGWGNDPSDSGLVVNGDNVTAYGLFSEHFQKYQTLWNGNGGAVYFYQSEMPYDVPDQGSWQPAPGHDGYPSYKVADGVTSHHAEGIGVYSVFSNPITAVNAIEFPAAAGVTMHHLMTVSLASGQITHIDNGAGGSVGNGNMTAYSAD